MPDTDAPQAEPLTLTLEEALARLGARGYMLAVYHHEDAPREYVLHDVYSAFARGSFGHWKDAAEAVLGVPVVPRDPAAGLVAAVESGLHYIKWAEEHGHMGAPSSRTLIEAALARVKGGELGEGWDEPYAHRDPGNGRPARTARNTEGES